MIGRGRAIVRALRRRREHRVRDERGYTLVEAMLSLLLFGLLLSTIPIVVQTMDTNQTYVNSTYLNLDQLLPVSTSFQELIRSVVAPEPTQAGSNPITAFGTYTNTGAIECSQSTTCGSTYSPTGTYQASPVVSGLTSFSATFFSNVGNPNGPAMVVANFTTPAGCAPATPSACKGSFKVTVAQANAGTCPFSYTDYSDHCTWGTPQVLLNVQDVTNICNTASPSASNCPQPLFQYTIQGFPVDPSTCPPAPATGQPPGCVPYPQGPINTSNGWTSFASCTSGNNASMPGFTNCPASQIQDVGIDLKVNASTNGSQADEQTVVYELSESSAIYDPAAG